MSAQTIPGADIVPDRLPPEGDDITSRQVQTVLRRLRACVAARTAMEGLTGRTAWERCERGDWLLWICGRIGVDRRLIVRAAAACAEIVRAHIPYATVLAAARGQR